MIYEIARERFLANADFDRAQEMQAYLKNHFKFFGIKTPDRRVLYKEFIFKMKKEGEVDWRVLDKFWDDEYREMQYFVTDFFRSREIEFDMLGLIEKYLTTKQWWDSIDSFVVSIGRVGLRDKRLNDLMVQYSLNEDFWLRRVSILHQLLRKEKTNQELLIEIIKNNLNQKEFFINKAIGWALRDYSKTNKTFVRTFLEQYKEGLSRLSVAEASKYL